MDEYRLPGRLILLTPVGTPPVIAEPQRKAFGRQLILPDWPDAAGNESIERYAERLADSIQLEARDDEPIFLAGISSGGPVALELAKRLDPTPRCVLLIGSARSEPALPLRVQLIERLQGWLSPQRLGALMPMGALAFSMVEGLDDYNLRLLRQASRERNVDLITWAGSALFDWHGDGEFGEDYPPVFQIHGQKDWVLPLRRQDADTVVSGGRHLIHLTHPVTVNRYIARHCRKTIAATHVEPAAQPDHAVAANAN